MGLAVAAAVRPADTGRPPVLELVGPAGAGKSAVAAALRRLDPQRCQRLALWGLPPLLLMRGALGLARHLGPGTAPRRPARAPAVLAQMVRVDALRMAVDRRTAPGYPALIMDEGPLFALGWLEVFYGHLADRALARWRRRTLAAWAERLNAVVLLDAPDEVLAARIRSRPKAHLVKDWPDGAIHGFTVRFRQAFERVLDDLQAHEPVALEVMDTARMAADEVAGHVLGLLQELSHGR